MAATPGGPAARRLADRRAVAPQAALGCAPASARSSGGNATPDPIVVEQPVQLTRERRRAGRPGRRRAPSSRPRPCPRPTAGARRTRAGSAPRRPDRGRRGRPGCVGAQGRVRRRRTRATASVGVDGERQHDPRRRPSRRNASQQRSFVRRPGPEALSQTGPAVGRDRGSRSTTAVTCGCSIGPLIRRPSRPRARVSTQPTTSRLPGRVEPGPTAAGRDQRPLPAAEQGPEHAADEVLADPRGHHPAAGPDARCRSSSAGPCAASRCGLLPAPCARARRPSGRRPSRAPGAAISRCCWAGVIVLSPVAVVGSRRPGRLPRPPPAAAAALGRGDPGRDHLVGAVAVDRLRRTSPANGLVAIRPWNWTASGGGHRASRAAAGGSRRAASGRRVGDSTVTSASPVPSDVIVFSTS